MAALVTLDHLMLVTKLATPIDAPDPGVHGVVLALKGKTALEPRHVHRQHDAAADVAGGQRRRLESVLSGIRPQCAEYETASNVGLTLKACTHKTE